MKKSSFGWFSGTSKFSRKNVYDPIPIYRGGRREVSRKAPNHTTVFHLLQNTREEGKSPPGKKGRETISPLVGGLDLGF